ncbi:MAG: hypothetical protein RLZZ338_615 [Cyanobacteriota bacterium]|jgi:hypothetical protein
MGLMKRVKKTVSPIISRLGDILRKLFQACAVETLSAIVLFHCEKLITRLTIVLYRANFENFREIGLGKTLPNKDLTSLTHLKERKFIVMIGSKMSNNHQKV